jgi:Tol biopolymer transport system component
VGVVAALKRCLQKDPSLRMRDIADARFQIEEALAAPVSSVQPVAHATTFAGYAGWVVAALVATGAAIATIPSGNPFPNEAPETRLQIVTPPADDPVSFALSPDGRSVVFQAGQGQPRLWLRPLASEESRPLTGTEGAIMPFWSPDSRSIGFFADGILKRIDLDGGFVRTLASAPQARRGAWNRDGTILFSAGSVGPLYSIASDGGAVKQVTNLLPGQTHHRWPQFLPDGQRFLFLTLGNPDVRGVYMGSLADTNLRRVSDRESAYSFMSPAHVLFARQGALWARRLDREYTRTEGEFIPVAPNVLVASFIANGFGAFSSSSTGSIAYRASGGERQLVWLDRTGRTVGVLGQPEDTQLNLSRLSSDGRTAAVYRIVDGDTDLWLVDTARGTSRRLTSDPATDGMPIFSPDDSRVMYVTDGKADIYQLYERRSDGTGGETLVLESDENKNTQDWSPDGRHVLFTNQSPKTNFDLWALPLFGGRKPVPVAQTPSSELFGRFSPDGRWIAFQSGETGRAEIYVQPFPGPGPKLQISVGGGTRPRWRRDGRELFYVAPDNRLMAVPVTEGSSSLDAAIPSSLFTLPRSWTFGYEPSPDGQRFLVSTAVSDASPITVILNWKPPAD